MTKNVLYVGNYLKGPKTNPSYMFTLGPLLEGLNFKVTYTSTWHLKVLRLLDMMWSLIRRQGQTDVVLIDTYSTQNFYYAVVIGHLCRFYKIPYIPILHGGQLPARLRRSPKLAKILFGNAFKNVAPSGYLSTVCRDQGIDNVVVIPNALDLTAYHFKSRKEASLNLLWVRRLSNIYNPMLALGVLKNLKEKGHRVKLCMVGSGGGQLKLMTQFATDHQLEVEFKGQLTRLEWIELSANYDLFLNTSTIDNTPLSIIEAMALGLGVVSTNVGGLTYLIDDQLDGFLVKPNEVEAMAEAVLQLVDQPDLFQSITLRARQKVECFDAQVVKHQWEDLLDEITKP